MIVLLLLGGLSLALSLLLIPLFRGAALRWNLVDVPDSTRKIHRHPIPRIGGVPVVLSAFGACLIVAALSAHHSAGLEIAFGAAKTVAPAALLIFLVGLADDIFGLKPWHKLAGQILAAAIAVFAGVEIRYLAGFTLHPWVGAAVTIGWLVGCANAVNLIDGVDGLAAGIALLASTTVIVAALLNGNMDLAAAIVPLAGALLGFLVFNSSPASIFLGDCGSLVLGFLLGCYGVLWSEKSATIVGMTAPLIAFAIPLLDVSLAVTRRFLRGKPIFGADRSHIHHRLLARGLTPRKVVLLLYIASGLAGSLALFVSRVRRPWDGAIIVLFALATIVGVNQLGYVEFGALRRLLLDDILRRTLNGQLAAHSLEDRLSAARTPQECWTAIEAASKEFGFLRIEMQFAGHTFRGHNRGGNAGSFEIRIPVSDEDWVELSHGFGPSGHPTAVVAFAMAVRNGLSPAGVVPASAARNAVICSSDDIRQGVEA